MEDLENPNHSFFSNFGFSSFTAKPNFGFFSFSIRSFSQTKLRLFVSHGLGEHEHPPSSSPFFLFQIIFFLASFHKLEALFSPISSLGSGAVVVGRKGSSLLNQARQRRNEGVLVAMGIAEASWFRAHGGWSADSVAMAGAGGNDVLREVSAR
ncbi:hypothetical protein V8G54_026739 [Vigna mungo]|uniref:Uncharacterized protein n=1 Tax=Vigna mungo TaxID=3915 RepID=A0AAQ3N149_VIGMU